MTQVQPTRNPFEGQRRLPQQPRRSLSLTGSLLSPLLKAFQPNRRNSSARIRSPLASALSRFNSPAWCSPSFPSIRSGNRALNSGPPRHQPRRIPFHSAPTPAAPWSYPPEFDILPADGPPATTPASGPWRPDISQNYSTCIPAAGSPLPATSPAPGSDARIRRPSANSHCRSRPRSAPCSDR